MVINQQLFSAVYLRELQAGKHPADTLEGARQTIRDWREEYPTLSQTSARTEYVRQCLSALGVSSSIRANKDGFTLFSDSAKAEATGVCLVTEELDLGRMVKGGHPQTRLVRELRKASLRWGILTNGIHWRLCCANASAPYEAFLQANLDELLVGPNLLEFLVFHRFWGGEAFLLTNGQLGLTRFLTESDKRTEAIERHLKSQVEPILQKLCLGFVQDEAASDYSAESLQVIYQNAIYLLYRILFLFYAEARGLLPIESEAYQPFGLEGMVKTARQYQEGATESDAFSLWKRLTRLFVVVDDGDEQLGVAAYNGGLFSDTEKPYLKNHKIRDEYLAPALFALGFEQTRNGFQPIDYRDLSVRHLGTLYEGLLEYRLNLVEREPVVVREAGGKRVFLPISVAEAVKNGETILEVGQVYFADDKGDRKASGSYYTPEDVVQYIVKNTVMPKLEERCLPFKTVLEEVERERIVAPTEEQRTRAEQYADSEALKAVEQGILRLRILDPAMGSGHFLVAATQTVTDFIIETLNATDWENESISTDPLFWKRRVVERCIYGVDKNPLAHELAKLSLWIASASAGKPLTFLDHHLKCGNSLYGTPLSRLATLPTAKKQSDDPLFRVVREQTIESVLKDLADITLTDSDTIEAVKHKGEVNRTIRAFMERLRAVADVWLATLFDLKTERGRAISEEEYHSFLSDLTRNYADEAWQHRVQLSSVLQNAQRIAEREKFFHWELEFPDSVVKGECRFDAVVKNPPYVGTKANVAITALYETAKCGDLYAWLFEKALQITGETGNVGTIVPMSLMFSRDFKPLRATILKRKGTARFANFDIRPAAIFDGVGQRATIALALSANNALHIETTNLIRFTTEDRPQLIKSLRFANVTPFVSEDIFPKLGDYHLVEFWLRAKKYSNSLGNYIYKPKKNTDPPPLFYVFVSGSGRYFMTAMPSAMRYTGLNVFAFLNEWQRDIAMVALNSNVFYWLWCVLGDGFHVTGENTVAMVLPRVSDGDSETIRLRDALLAATEECATSQMKWGKQILNFNFNKRMDILLDIDAWIVKHIAPDLNLPRDIFAQYKSNSFLRSLDLSALMGVEEMEEC